MADEPTIRQPAASEAASDEPWLERVQAALDLDGVELDPESLSLLLDLTREIAHGVERRVAPLSTFLVGVAVGRGRSVSEAVAKVDRLVDQW